MEATLAGRKDYANLLADLGFLPRDYADHMGPTGPARGFTSPFDQYSENARIVKAALCAGVAPVSIHKYIASIEKEESPGTPAAGLD